MAFSLDDLADWIRDLVDQGSNAVNVINGNAPLTNLQSVNQNVKQGIIDPGKMLSEFSGLAQGYRGAKPNASNMDRGLAFLALTGALSGAGDDVARLASKGVKAAKPKYAYGLHVSPVDNLKKIKPGSKVGIDGGGYFGDAEEGFGYFFNSGKNSDMTQVQMAVNEYIDRLMGGSRNGVNVYSIKTPLKKISSDDNMNMGSFVSAFKTPKNLKVKGSIKQNPMMVLHNWGSKTYSGPEFPKNADELINNLGKLIQKQKPNRGKSLDEITSGFRSKMNSVMQNELESYSKYLEKKNQPVKKVLAVKPKDK